MNPLQIAAVLLLLTVLLEGVFASVAAPEAVDWIENQNHFLKKNDSIETPTVLIEHDNQKYWLIPVIAGADLTTFFPVSFADKTVSVNEGVNRELFATARFLRGYLPYRNQSRTNKSWFIGSDNAFIISNLSSDLKSSQFQLNNLKSELDSVGETSDIDSMQAALSQMADVATALGDNISAAVTTENDFLENPSTATVASIKEKFGVAYDSLFQLESLARQYQEMENELKTKISGSAKLTAAERNNLIPLASAPQSLYTIGSKNIGNWVITANENKQSVETIFNQSKSLSFLDTAVSEFNKRLRQNETYQGIFGVDPEFSAASGSPSLKLAIDDLQLPEKKSLWKNRGELQTALTQYQSAVDLLNSEEFELSKIAAQKAKSAVLNVIADGFVEEQPTGINPQDLINAAIIGFILVILVYALKNRGNIMTAISSGGENKETELDFYGWNKK